MALIRKAGLGGHIAQRPSRRSEETPAGRPDRIRMFFTRPVEDHRKGVVGDRRRFRTFRDMRLRRGGRNTRTRVYGMVRFARLNGELSESTAPAKRALAVSPKKEPARRAIVTVEVLLAQRSR